VKQRHVVLLFLVSLSILTFIDRICIAVLGPRMMEDLAIPPDRWGWVLGAFVLAYGAFEIPTGAMGDRIGQRKVITRIVLWWSAFTSLTGAVTSFVPLVIIRFLFGAGEAGAYPNIAGCVARWFPRTERARVQGFVWAASRLGGALAPLLVVPIQSAYGWRATFFIFGAAGFTWAALWFWWYRDRPDQKPSVTPRELEEIGSPAPSAHPRVPWKVLFSSRQMWIITGMYFSYAWGSWFYFAWLHTFLVKGRGFTDAEMGLLSSFPFFLSASCNLFGGFLSDIMTRRYGASIGRRLIGAVSLTIAGACIAATPFVQGKAATMILLSLGFGVADIMLPTAWAICLDVGGRFSGSVTGTMNTAGQLGGFLCSVLFGYVVRATGDYNTPLLLIAFMTLVGAFLFSRIDPTRPLFPAEAEAAQKTL